MELAMNLKLQCERMTLAEFERRYPHPWLLRELTVEERSALTPTNPMMQGAASYPTAALPPPPSAQGLRLSARLLREPHRFALLPVAKTKANPWHGRILIGRASNNDVILRDQSISKLHAHLRRDASNHWRLHDVSSINGIVVNGSKVAPVGDGVTVHSGALIQFGSQRCEFLDGGEVYTLLAGGARFSYSPLAV